MPAMVPSDREWTMKDELSQIKKQKWFYEFNLPDGSKTESYLPDNARLIHPTREKALRQYLDARRSEFNSALDISCHEGYFSQVLKEYCPVVRGIDKNPESLRKAELISRVMGRSDIDYTDSSLESWPTERGADFVLCYGLLYHVENTVEVVRKVAALTRRVACIETQVLPFNFGGSIEDGSYQWQREIHGLFGLCVDYSQRSEGGMTDLALVPSRNGLEFLLQQFGFRSIKYYPPEPSDYEQFVRGHRLIVFAEK
ncbi:MAG: methyltransferase domain-containing protein [Acidobacteria bacterium]|nr:methyltransferase domain-containing protein [Acidobacteriota bacterium]